MKKTLLVLSIATFALGLTSCVKDYDCECVTTTTINGNTTTNTHVENVKGTKKTSKVACDAFDTESPALGSKVECEIK